MIATGADLSGYWLPVVRSHSDAAQHREHDQWQMARRYVSEVSMSELRKMIGAKEAALAAANALSGQQAIA